MDLRDLQTNWSGGEVSKISAGRFDVEKYRNGADRLENFVIKSQGGIFYRPGFQHVINCHNQARISRLLDFRMDEDNSVLVELGHEYLRITDNGVVIATLPSPWTESQLWDVDTEQSFDVMWLVHGSHRPRELVYNRALDTWSLREMQFTVTPYYSSAFTDDAYLILHGVSDRRTLTSVSGVFATAVVGNYVQYVVDGIEFIGKILTITSTNEVLVEPYEDQKLDLSDEVYITATTTGPDTITLSASAAITKWEIGGYLQLARKDTTAKQWFLVGSIRGDYGAEANGTHIVPTFGLDPENDIVPGVREVKAGITANKPIWDSADGEIFIRLHFDNNIINARVLQYATAVTVNVSLNRVLPSGYSGKTSDWRWGQWHNGNWPQRIAMFEQRLVFSGTYDQPNGHWQSEVEDFYSFASLNTVGEVEDSSAINYNLASDGYTRQRWMIADTGVSIATSRTIFRAGGNSTSGQEPITPRNFRAVSSNTFGASSARPVRVGQTTLYVQNDDEAIREFMYDLQTDSHVSQQINFMAEHILKDHGGCVEMCFMDTPDPTVFFVCRDGQLAVLTYVREQEVMAFGRFIHGNGQIESVRVVRSNGHSSLCVLVKRGNLRIIEQLGSILRIGEDSSEMVYLDSSVQISGVVGAELHFPNLALQFVRPVLDGEALPAVQLDATGRYVLPRDVTSGWIGIGFSGVLRSLPIRGGSSDGMAAAGIRRRIRIVTLALYNSLGFKFSPGNDRFMELSFRSTEHPTDELPPLFTGEKRFELQDSEPTFQPQYTIKQDDPYPLNILGVYLELQLS